MGHKTGKTIEVVYVSYGNKTILDGLNGAGESLAGLEEAILADAQKSPPIISGHEQQPCLYYELVIQQCQGEIIAYHVLDEPKTRQKNHAGPWDIQTFANWINAVPRLQRFPMYDYAGRIKEISARISEPGKVLVPNAPMKPNNKQADTGPRFYR